MAFARRFTIMVLVAGASLGILATHSSARASTIYHYLFFFGEDPGFGYNGANFTITTSELLSNFHQIGGISVTGSLNGFTPTKLEVMGFQGFPTAFGDSMPGATSQPFQTVVGFDWATDNIGNPSGNSHFVTGEGTYNTPFAGRFVAVGDGFNVTVRYVPGTLVLTSETLPEEPVAAPEPATLVVLASGLGALGMLRRRQARSVAPG